jgi:hypothetical protein
MRAAKGIRDEHEDHQRETVQLLEVANGQVWMLDSVGTAPGGEIKGREITVPWVKWRACSLHPD